MNEPHAVERVPGVCMDPAARYTKCQWSAPRGAVLTDRKIAKYQKEGRYQRNRLKLPETAKARLVYSC